MIEPKKENVILLGDFSEKEFEERIWKTRSSYNYVLLLLAIFLIVINIVIPRASAEENFLLFTLHLVAMATGVYLFFSTSIFLATKHGKLLDEYRLQKIFVKDGVLNVIQRKRIEDSNGIFIGYRVEKFVCANIKGFRVGKSHIVVKGVFPKETIRPAGTFRSNLKSVHNCKIGRCLVKEKELVRHLKQMLKEKEYE